MSMGERSGEGRELVTTQVGDRRMVGDGAQLFFHEENDLRDLEEIGHKLLPELFPKILRHLVPNRLKISRAELLALEAMRIMDRSEGGGCIGVEHGVASVVLVGHQPSDVVAGLDDGGRQVVRQVAIHGLVEGGGKLAVGHLIGIGRVGEYGNHW
jgi:hypothetical protein